MAYKKGDEKKYFTTVIAALITLAVVIGAIVYSSLRTSPENLDYIIVENLDGTVMVDPVGTDGPTGPPSVPFPSYPPPNQ